MDSTFINYNDEELWKEVKFNNYAAFELIYNRYSSLLFNSEFAIIKEKEACEDILQDVFVNIWINRHRLDIHSLKPYLLKSVRNRVLMYLRERMPFLTLETIENNVAAFTTPEESLSAKNTLNEIYKRLEILPEKCKEIFILSRKYQLSNKEISEKLNVSVKTVENQITIAIRKLRPVNDKAVFLTLLICTLKAAEYISMLF